MSQQDIDNKNRLLEDYSRMKLLIDVTDTHLDEAKERLEYYFSQSRSSKWYEKYGESQINKQNAYIIKIRQVRAKQSNHLHITAAGIFDLELKACNLE